MGSKIEAESSNDTRLKSAPTPMPASEAASPSTPEFTFTYPPRLSRFAVPAVAFTGSYLLAPHTKEIIVGALIFSPSRPITPPPPPPPPPPQILLLRRAATDYFPLRWEIPGGTCDGTGASILHGLAREVWEETGLRVLVVRRLVGERVLGKGGVAVKFEFEVEGGMEGEGEGKGSEREWEDMKIVLDPNEHADYVWASEEECVVGRIEGEHEGEGMELVFTTEDQRDGILEGLRVRRRGVEGAEI